MSAYREREREALRQLAVEVLGDKRASAQDRTSARKRLECTIDETPLDADDLTLEELQMLDAAYARVRGEKPLEVTPPRPIVAVVCERCRRFTDGDLAELADVIDNPDPGDAAE